MWLILRQFNYCQLKCSKIRTLLDLKIISICRQCCLSGPTNTISVSIATTNSAFVKAAFLNRELLWQNIQTKIFSHCHGLDLKGLKIWDTLFEVMQIEVQWSKKYFKNFLSQDAGASVKKYRKNRKSQG